MSVSKEDIFNETKSIIVNMFGTDPDLITPQASLFEDLDLDSIDAVDLVVQLQKYTKRKFSPEDFKQVRTIEDVVNIVAKILDESDSESKQQ